MTGRLQKRLDRIRESFESQAPADVLAVMHRATDDLRASGILDGVIQPGDTLPAFRLPDVNGAQVESADLLAGGPVVLTFYRGAW